MTNLREAAQMASSPCEYCGHHLPKGVDKKTRQERSYHFEKCDKRPCLAPHPEQEPIAWIVITKDGLEWEDNHTIHPVKQNGDWFQFPVYLPSQRDFKFSTIEEAMQPMPPAPERPQLTDNETRFANAFTALVRAGYGKEAEVVLKCKPKWQGLTDEELRSMCKQTWVFDTIKQWAKIIEAKLREKNT